MPDWKSAAEIARDSKVLDKLLHAFVGVYLWVTGLPRPSTKSDHKAWQMGVPRNMGSGMAAFIRGEEVQMAPGASTILHMKARFRSYLICTQVLYFANRYLLLGALIGM